jgi:hypothetical protein
MFIPPTGSDVQRQFGIDGPALIHACDGSAPCAAACWPAGAGSRHVNGTAPLSIETCERIEAAIVERLRGELDQLLRSLGITTIHVTHDQAEAMGLGDRIIEMQQGEIVQFGTPCEVHFEPNSRFVAEFIGAANMIAADSLRFLDR